MVPKITTIETIFSLTIKQLRSTAIFGGRRPTEGIAAKAAEGDSSPSPLGVQGDKQCGTHLKTKKLAAASFCFEVRSGIEPL